MDNMSDYDWLVEMDGPVASPVSITEDFIPEPIVSLPKKMNGRAMNTSGVDRALHRNGLSSFMFSYSSTPFNEQLVKYNICNGLSGPAATAAIRRLRYRRDAVLNIWTRCMLVDVMMFMNDGLTKEDMFLFKRFMNWRISTFDWTMDVLDPNLEYVNIYTEFQTMCSPGSDIGFPMEDTVNF